MTRKIAVLTSSRADFSHLVWPLRQIDAHPGLTLQLLVTGAHLSHEFGHSITEIEAAGFDVAHRIESLLSSDSDVGMAKTIGVTMLGLTEILAADRPDILLLIADRYEMLAPAAAALALRIPMAHIEGGEISEGAIDDAVRNALTKMAHLHFTPTENARRRVVAMGEEAWRVHAVGAPSIDTLSNQPLDDRDTIASKLKMSLQPAPALVSIHPVTLLDDTLSELDAILDAIRGLDAPIAFCFPNADAGSRELARRARLFCDTRDDARVFVNLPPHEYWSLLSHSAVLIGNSSSGIMETPTLGVPTVNVGERQRGRDRAANIIDVAAEAAAIRGAISRAVSDEFRAVAAGAGSPYGDGTAGSRIADLLARAPGRERLLQKRALSLVVGDDNRYAFAQQPEDN